MSTENQYIVGRCICYPIGSMYEMFTYIYHKNQPNNVGKYSIPIIVGKYSSPMDCLGIIEIFPSFGDMWVFGGVILGQQLWYHSLESCIRISPRFAWISSDRNPGETCFPCWFTTENWQSRKNLNLFATGKLPIRCCKNTKRNWHWEKLVRNHQSPSKSLWLFWDV